MALLELRELIAPVPTEFPREDRILDIIFTNLRERFGKEYTQDKMREYVIGTDDEARRESKALRQMPRGLGRNEILVVIITNKIDAFVYAHPIVDENGNVTNRGAWNAGGLEFVGGSTLEKLK